ncbi:MAG: hypothetical protein ACI8PZ_005819 [Myxococcota bacterium]|jgi:hypothetical protein
MLRVLLALVSLNVLLPRAALAQCADEVRSDLTCASVASNKLVPPAWVGPDPVPSFATEWTCPNGFDPENLDSDVGATCDYTTALGACGVLGCVDEGYTCGDPSAERRQGGPEDVYRFVCERPGAVRTRIRGLDCDLDYYVLDSTCDPESRSSCVDGGTKAGTLNDQVNFDCTYDGEVFYLIVEGFGHSWEGLVTYDLDGAGYCNPEAGGGVRGGDYELIFITDNPAVDYCYEDCEDGIDNNGDGLVDCADPICGCPGEPEDCFDGIDNDFDGDIDCEDIDCFNNDGDGFIAEICGGTDCDDSYFNCCDPDGDGIPASPSCDICPDDFDPAQLNSDGDHERRPARWRWRRCRRRLRQLPGSREPAPDRLRWRRQGRRLRRVPRRRRPR